MCQVMGLAGDCLQRFEGLGVEGEGFGSAAATFQATEFLHGNVPVVEQRLHALTHMAQTCLVLEFDHRVDVHPMRGREHL